MTKTQAKEFITFAAVEAAKVLARVHGTTVEAIAAEIANGNERLISQFCQLGESATIALSKSA